MKTLPLSLAVLFSCAAIASAGPSPTVSSGVFTYSLCSYLEYSNNATHTVAGKVYNPDSELQLLEAKPDTKQVTFQNYSPGGSYLGTDVYTREAEGSNVWIHTSY